MRLDQLGRVGHPGLGDLGEQLGRLGHLAGSAERAGLAVGALEQAGHDLAALLHQPQHVAAELLRIGDPVGAEVDLGRHGLAGLGGFLSASGLSQRIRVSRPIYAASAAWSCI